VIGAVFSKSLIAFLMSLGITQGGPAPFTVQCAPTTMALGWTGSESVSCTIAGAEDFDGDVGVACAGLPAGAVCRVDTPIAHVRPGTTATATLHVVYDEGVPAGQSSMQVTASQGSVSASATVAVLKNLDTVFRACPSRADMAAIDHDLKLSFESDPTRGAYTCLAANGSRDLTLMQARVYGTLAAARRLSFDAPLPWTRDPLYKWMIKTIRGIRFRDGIPNSFCCDPANMINVRAHVEGMPQHGLAIAITQSQMMATDSRLLRGFLDLIVHEARHNNGPRHSCPDNTRDQTIGELGAWGAAYYTNVWLADHLDPNLVTPTLREDARRAAAQICAHQLCKGDCPQ
jgi:hypothetical protein